MALVEAVSTTTFSRPASLARRMLAEPCTRGITRQPSMRAELARRASGYVFIVTINTLKICPGVSGEGGVGWCRGTGRKWCGARAPGRRKLCGARGIWPWRTPLPPCPWYMRSGAREAGHLQGTTH